MVGNRSYNVTFTDDILLILAKFPSIFIVAHYAHYEPTLPSGFCCQYLAQSTRLSMVQGKPVSSCFFCIDFIFLSYCKVQLYDCNKRYSPTSHIALRYDEAKNERAKLGLDIEKIKKKLKENINPLWVKFVVEVVLAVPFFCVFQTI